MCEEKSRTRMFDPWNRSTPLKGLAPEYMFSSFPMFSRVFIILSSGRVSPQDKGTSATCSTRPCPLIDHSTTTLFGNKNMRTKHGESRACRPQAPPPPGQLPKEATGGVTLDAPAARVYKPPPLQAGIRNPTKDTTAERLGSRRVATRVPEPVLCKTHGYICYPTGRLGEEDIASQRQVQARKVLGLSREPVCREEALEWNCSGW